MKKSGPIQLPQQHAPRRSCSRWSGLSRKVVSRGNKFVAVVFFVTTAVTPLPVAEPESPLIEASAAGAAAVGAVVATGDNADGEEEVVGEDPIRS